MKNMKKLASILLALVMVLAMATTAFAADDGSITIKNPTAGETYKVYKLFDLTYSGNNVSYTYTKDGDADSLYDALTADDSPFTLTIPNGGTDYIVSVKDGKTDEAIIAWVEENAALLTYVTEATPSSADPLVFGNLGYGYYYITSSLGSLVTIDSTLKDVEVTDKNETPKLDKTITGATAGDIDEDGKNAIAQVGTSVNFEVKIDIGAGMTNYVFHDTMSNTLEYNGDVSVWVNGVEYPAKNDDDTVNFDTTTAQGDTITVTFEDAFINRFDKDDVITVKYSATVTSAALTIDAANNTAYLNYNDPNGQERTPDSTTEIYNAKFTVTKTDGTNALPGAGFVVKNDAGKYYKYTAATADASAKVEWVDNINDATELTSNESGAVVNTELGLTAFTGLANGTYTLVEKTVPNGYNKAADQNFTIAADDYTPDNLDLQATTVINKSGTELPSTGGIGTTIFYVSGAVLAIAAVVFLVTKKRMSGEEE